MVKRGRATLAVQFKAVTARTVHQWYVLAEGRIAFTDDDPAPHVRVMLARDRGDAWADRWDSAERGDRVAVLDPDRLSGFGFRPRDG